LVFVTVVFPTSIDDAIEALADPDADVLAGGTDYMVQVNAGVRRPARVVSVHRVEALRGWGIDAGSVRLGAGLTYTEMLDPALARLVPALAHAARTVGSPPIRNSGTLGGNLGTSSPAGDTLPVLIALDAVIEVAGPTGRRDVPMLSFCVGPKRSALEAGELIVAVRVPLDRGPQEYRKVGTRNAMVIAVASVALSLDLAGRAVRVGLGSVGPTPLRAPAAERWLADRIDWNALSADPAWFVQFGSLVADEAQPIDDHRSTAAYRRHAVGVLARRSAAALLSQAADGSRASEGSQGAA
jgi:CO/xanthine dehydrogenase FAD-binding subunit